MPVIAAGYDVMNDVLFGSTSQSTADYFRGVQQNISDRAKYFSSDFIEGSKQMFENTYSSRALDLARMAINKAGSLFSADVIKELKTMTEFQVAKPIMRRYIMAHPTMREMYFNNRCSGYDGNFYDSDPGKIGENHYDFRRVMNGVLHEDKDKNFIIKHYVEELREDGQELTVGKQFDILNSQDRAVAFMALADKDPTSEWNDDL